MLGAGIMGAAMARSLAREGHDVSIWNRTPERAQAAAGDRIVPAASVAEAVSGADAVVTMLFDAESVLAVTDELVGALRDDAVWVQSSTIGPAGIRRVAEAAGPASRRLLDAPVLGTRQPAEGGKLVVLASGPASAREAAAPVLDAVGGRTVVAGDEVGPASALKLAANSWVAMLTAAAAQGLGLAESLGVDPALLLEAVGGGGADSPYLQLKGRMMIDRDWATPSFAVGGVLKDVGLMIDAAREARFPDALLVSVHELFQAASGAGVHSADMAAVRVAFDR